MKTICHTYAYNRLIHIGTLNACIKAAEKEDEKANQDISSIEIWAVCDEDKSYYLATISKFW